MQSSGGGQEVFISKIHSDVIFAENLKRGWGEVFFVLLFNLDEPSCMFTLRVLVHHTRELCWVQCCTTATVYHSYSSASLKNLMTALIPFTWRWEVLAEGWLLGSKKTPPVYTCLKPVSGPISKWNWEEQYLASPRWWKAGDISPFSCYCLFQKAHLRSGIQLKHGSGFCNFLLLMSCKLDQKDVVSLSKFCK